MNDLFDKLNIRKRQLDGILSDVDTLCNDDGSPVIGGVNESIKELIREVYKRTKNNDLD